MLAAFLNANLNALMLNLSAIFCNKSEKQSNQLNKSIV